ncbi:hypothetical protein AB0C81_20110 [Streptomyces roseoverticillatus]|uniref:hypothetical protein n=1 Tax=Streptomyces roseoverticillatus TaxID=66429 RepID=UPI0033E28DE6
MNAAYEAPAAADEPTPAASAPPGHEPGHEPGHDPGADPGPGPAGPESGAATDSGPDPESEHAWDSRRDLYRHSPGIMLGRSAQLGGSLVGGDQHGVSGGQVTGDVILGGSKVEYRLGGDDEERSGEIPAAEVEALARNFAFPSGGEDDDGAPGDTWEPGSPFGLALARLKTHRVAVLSGPATTGRRAAALMLLRAVGSTAYRALDPALAPGRLAGEVRDGCGHLIDDFPTSAEQPLREHHLRALSEKLGAAGSHLVVVVGPHPVVHGGAGHIPWRPPEPAALLRSHLRHKDLAGHSIGTLLALPEVQAVLGHRRPVADLAAFADRIAAHAQGLLPLAGLAGYGHYAAERQVRAWFDGTEQTLHDKAFLIALATFNEAPYPLTAELSDVLFGLLQRIENPGEPARIPVFGTSSAQRVEHAQADRYLETEETEWGPVLQTKVQFRDPLTAITLLREVWTGHPSARPALVTWLRRLADDPRPVVRTRAASTAAVLAHTDLPSAMALLIRPWVFEARLRARLAAASALALAHHLGTPHVPRILREWCTTNDHRLRRAAVRTYALVGDAFAAEAVEALLAAVRAMEARGGPVRTWPAELDELAQSAAAVLLAAGQNAGAWEAGGAAAELWSALVPLARGGLARDFALRTVVHACGPVDGAGGRPLLLDLFGRAEATAGTPGALLRQSLAALWRMVLNDPLYSASGLAALRGWVRAAGSDPDAERALTELLPLLAVSVEDTKRLVYLLENLRGGADPAPPAVALRLRGALSPPPAP